MNQHKILKEKNFLLFLFGNNTSIFGDIILLTGFSLFVMLTTKSAIQFSLTLAITFIPRVVLSPFSGVIVDRLKKKRMIVFLDLIRGVWLIGLYLISLKSGITMSMIYISLGFFAICDTFFAPAYMTVFTKIVDKDHLSEANAISNSLKNTVSVLSPLIASYIFSVFGLPLLLLIDGITFFLSATLEVLLKFEDIPTLNNNKIFHEFKDGIHMITENTRLKSLLINGNLTHLFLFPFIEVGVIYLLLIIFKAPELHYGIVQSSQSLGAILSGFFALHFRKRHSVAKNINIGIIGMLISVLLFELLIFTKIRDILTLTEHLPTVYLSITCFVIFLAFHFYGVFFGSFYQAEVPNELLGRFTSILIMTFSISRLLGMVMYGYLFELNHLNYALIILLAGMALKLVVHIPFMKYEESLKNKRKKAIAVGTESSS